MKTAAYLTVFAAALFTLPLAQAVMPTQSQVQSGIGKVTVNFPNWEKYDDILDEFEPSDQGELNILKEMTRSMDALAGQEIPEGEHLTLTFTNIDLAGEFLASNRALRTMKTIYPPRLVFTYSLTNSTGQVIKSGKEDLTDDLYLQRIPNDPGDPRNFEKTMMKDWMETKLLGR
jgi:hypothetical protein